MNEELKKEIDTIEEGCGVEIVMVCMDEDGWAFAYEHEVALNKELGAWGMDVDSADGWVLDCKVPESQDWTIPIYVKEEK